MDKKEIATYLTLLKTPWEVSENSKSISKQFKLKDFKDAIEFVNKIAEIAEKQGHHPNISVYYNKVKIMLTTRAIKGLSMNDFIIASKIEVLQDNS